MKKLIILFFVLSAVLYSCKTENKGKFLVYYLKEFKEEPEMGYYLKTHYSQKDLTDKVFKTFSLPLGTISFDRYDIYQTIGYPSENKFGQTYVIIITNEIGQVNPSDPGFGPVSVKKGFYTKTTEIQGRIRWKEINNSVLDSIHNYL